MTRLSLSPQPKEYKKEGETVFGTECKLNFYILYMQGCKVHGTSLPLTANTAYENKPRLCYLLGTEIY